jgi:thiol:disulfide interchange protein DsbD
VGSSVTFSGDVSWLVCEDVCLPGKRTVSIELPVSESSTPANDEIFSAWTNLLPVRESNDVAKVNVPDVNPAGGETHELAVEWSGTLPENIEWFPPPSQQIEFSGVVVQTQGTRTTIRFVARPYGKTRPDAGAIHSVLGYTLDGQRKGLVVPVNIVAAASDAPRVETSNR